MPDTLDPALEAALTFADLRKANEARQAFWGGSDNWTLADWSNALAGEVGEACNIVKKIRRPELGTTGNDKDVGVYRAALKSEIGDVLIYLDLLAMATGATLQECAETAFNSKSEKLGMPIRLAASPQAEIDRLREALRESDRAARYLIERQRDQINGKPVRDAGEAWAAWTSAEVATRAALSAIEAAK